MNEDILMPDADGDDFTPDMVVPPQRDQRAAKRLLGDDATREQIVTCAWYGYYARIGRPIATDPWAKLRRSSNR